MTIAAATAVAAPADALSLTLGPYQARISSAPDVMTVALDLRRKVFAATRLSDQDAFDPISLHGIVTDMRHAAPRVAFRVRLLRDGMDLNATYTGRTYGLQPLQAGPGPVLELGRVCHCGTTPDPMALRVAWAALTAFVDRHQVGMLVGCTSFPGADPDRHDRALAELRRAHIGPAHLLPARKSPHAVDLPVLGSRGTIPHLLASYLAMGGWVGDHAVIDRALDTVHVFTGLCVADIPERRKRRLRALVRTGAVSA